MAVCVCGGCISVSPVEYTFAVPTTTCCFPGGCGFHSHPPTVPLAPSAPLPDVQVTAYPSSWLCYCKEPFLLSPRDHVPASAPGCSNCRWLCSLSHPRFPLWAALKDVQAVSGSGELSCIMFLTCNFLLNCYLFRWCWRIPCVPLGSF